MTVVFTIAEDGEVNTVPCSISDSLGSCVGVFTPLCPCAIVFPPTLRNPSLFWCCLRHQCLVGMYEMLDAYAQCLLKMAVFLARPYRFFVL